MALLLTYFVALTAALCLSSAAPTQVKTPQQFLIKTVATIKHSEVTDLFAQIYHSGAALNNIAMVPIGDADVFQINLTDNTIYYKQTFKEYGKRTSYFNYLAIPNDEVETKSLEGTYNQVEADQFTRKHDTWIIAEDDVINPSPVPANFFGFAVCNVKEISDDEPYESYQQLVWKKNNAEDKRCTNVNIVAMKPY